MRRPNVDIEIFLDGNAPPAEADATARVFLQDRWKDIEYTEGDTTHLWNAILECDIRVDLRDDYPATPANALIYTLDKEGDREQGYRVIYVEKVQNTGFRKPFFKRVYLLRLAQGTVDDPDPPQTDCCDDPLQAVLYATFVSTDCPCASGTQITLNYSAANDSWSGSGSFGTCGTTVTLTFSCEGTDFQLIAAFSDSAGDQESFHTTLICDPFFVQFAQSELPTNCSGGAHTWEVEKTP